ncbi:MAG TPA: PQQ-binding-like beta-propeller repeat protein [Thermomicrobiales bacterium]|nr:PQQ-binding-like beta-propeller repeat protein [Thermomicrobiales bacterium]
MMARVPVLHTVVVALMVVLAATMSPAAVLGRTQSTEETVIGRRGDASLSGAMPGNGPASEPAILWEASSNGGVIMGMAIDGDVLYFATKDPGAVVAVDRATGAVLWSTDFGEDATVFGPAPADDVVAVGVWAGDANGVVGLDGATGAERWRVSTDSLPKAPTLADGTVYVVAEGGLSAEPELLAIDVQSGTERWRVQPPESPNLGDQAAIADGVVVAGTLAFDAASGEQLWAFTGTDSPSFDPVIHDGTALIVDLPTVWAIDLRTGQTLWELSGASQGGGIAAADGSVYIGFGDEVRAVESQSGAERWSAPVSGVAGAPVVANGVVYSAVWTPPTDRTPHSLHAIDAATGTSVWALELEHKVSGNQPLADAETLYVDTNEGVVAFGAGSGTTSPGGAASGSAPQAQPGTYASPEFGYAVAWASPWQIVAPQSSTAPGQDFLTLQAGDFTLAVRAASGIGTPEEVIQIYLSQIQGAYADLEVIDRVESPELSRMTVRFTIDGVPMIEYIEIRALTPGSLGLTILYGPADWMSMGFLSAQQLVSIDQQPPFRAAPAGVTPAG